MSKTALLFALATTTAVASLPSLPKVENVPLSPAEAHKNMEAKASTGTPGLPEKQPSELPSVKPQEGPAPTHPEVSTVVASNPDPLKEAVAVAAGANTSAPTAAAAPAASVAQHSSEDNHKTGTAPHAHSLPATAIPAPASAPVPAAEPTAFTPTQEASIEKIIANYIKNNAGEVVTAIRVFGEEQQKELLKREAAKISQFKNDLLNDTTAIVGGNPNGTIKLVVFADPNCPHCRHLEANLSEIKGLFSNLKVYLRPWAIMGPESSEVVSGLMATAKSGYDKYDSVALRIATSNEKIDKKKFLKFSKELGLDVKKIQKAMESEEVRNSVNYNHELAVKMKLDATPTILMFDAEGAHIILPGDKEALKKTLSEAKA
ncbi:DsbA family protein [Candidatus Odyssella thessalonicensis]|uniref:DsbA family protein n=1 Tax=Candidatus Odyssella thessalonicensis TaxID=84647 RepID=UPI000225B1AA|nr:thioredoxin domain-containing protein [Candidatus Odyssella thessalonicensis]